MSYKAIYAYPWDIAEIGAHRRSSASHRSVSTL